MSASTAAAEINIGYLRRADPKSTLSLIEMPAANDGVAGAGGGGDDNKTTGGGAHAQSFLVEGGPSGGNDARGGGPGPAGGARPPGGRRSAAGRAPQARRRWRPAQAPVLQCRRDRRSITGGQLPRQCDSYGSNPVDAGRRSGAVSGLEAVAQMAVGRRFPRRGQALRRCTATLGQAVR